MSLQYIKLRLSDAKHKVGAAETAVIAFGLPYCATNGYDRELALAAVADRRADMIDFGRPFIANPDLSARLLCAAPLEEASPDLYYGGRKGYTDFQPLDVAANEAASTLAGAAGELGR